MRILVTGKNGQVGHELRRTLAPLGDLIATDRDTLDLADIGAVRARLREIRPEVIVNAAAYTSVDRAEDEADLADAINAVAPGAIASEAERLGALLVHYSTDYVFDGTKAEAYVEDDSPNPQSAYGRSKLGGEAAIRATTHRHLILRTSWVFGAHGANFLKTIVRLAQERSSLNVVGDQFGAPTPAAVIAEVTAALISQYLSSDPDPFALGTYHLAATGATHWCDYAKYVVAAANQAGIATRLRADAIMPVTTQEYGAKAPRPANSRLNTRKITETFGISLPPWQQGVDDVLRQLF